MSRKSLLLSAFAVFSIVGTSCLLAPSAAQATLLQRGIAKIDPLASLSKQTQRELKGVIFTMLQVSVTQGSQKILLRDNIDPDVQNAILRKTVQQVLSKNEKRKLTTDTLREAVIDEIKKWKSQKEALLKQWSQSFTQELERNSVNIYPAKEELIANTLSQYLTSFVEKEKQVTIDDLNRLIRKNIKSLKKDFGILTTETLIKDHNLTKVANDLYKRFSPQASSALDPSTINAVVTASATELNHEQSTQGIPLSLDRFITKLKERIEQMHDGGNSHPITQSALHPDTITLPTAKPAALAPHPSQQNQPSQ